MIYDDILLLLSIRDILWNYALLIFLSPCLTWRKYHFLTIFNGREKSFLSKSRQRIKIELLELTAWSLLIKNAALLNLTHKNLMLFFISAEVKSDSVEEMIERKDIIINMSVFVWEHVKIKIYCGIHRKNFSDERFRKFPRFSSSKLLGRNINSSNFDTPLAYLRW